MSLFRIMIDVGCAALFPFQHSSILLTNAAEITDLVSKHLQPKNVGVIGATRERVLDP